MNSIRTRYGRGGGEVNLSLSLGREKLKDLWGRAILPGICIPRNLEEETQGGCKGWFGMEPECRACREIGSFDSRGLLFYFILSTSNLYPPRVINCASFQVARFFLVVAEEDDDSYLQLGYSIILYIIFHIFTIFIDIFKNSKLRISRNPCIEP